MKIVFISNYLSPHQLPFCLAMDRHATVEFAFVATLPVSDARMKLGYEDLDKKYPFVICAYESEMIKAQCKLLIEQADIVIVGTAPYDLVRGRIKLSKITFRVSERQLKRGFEPLKYFYRYIRWHKMSPNRKPCYLLCASAYAAYDYSLFGLYKNRAYKWGYFPETMHYENICGLIAGKERNSILWVGRLLDWKRPLLMLQLAAMLKRECIPFHINIIGTGPFEDILKNGILEQHLENDITMLGARKVEEVRKYMEKSEIFVTTSNRQEGWGAVVNEAMNSGCAVVASSLVGAAPYLISHGVNGMIYAHDKIDECVAAVKELLQNRALQQSMGVHAYSTIVKEWNANMAAERFVFLCQYLLENKSIDNLFADGICSQAPILKNTWLPNRGVE